VRSIPRESASKSYPPSNKKIQTIRTQGALLYFMIIIVIEQVDQQDRSTQSTDKARDKKTQKKRENLQNFCNPHQATNILLQISNDRVDTSYSIDATTIIIILN
jgi:hypothetical protein